MTANWITAHGFTARSVTPQGRYAGYSGHHGFTPRRHAELVSASSRYDNNKTLKPFNQTPYYNFTGRGQMVKAAVQGDGKISIGAQRAQWLPGKQQTLKQFVLGFVR